MGSVELKKKIDEWLAWDRNQVTSQEIKRLVNEKQFQELERILLTRLTFGTAGLRGRMAAGYARMNDLVIVQTGQGLLRYLQLSNKKLLAEHGVVIGYDGRHNSRRWAELTTAIFLHSNYQVKLFSEVCPTPFVPFSVLKYKAAAGIMVTASHNPKEDNGYKVYGPNGCQIISPVDKEIQKHILGNLEPRDSSWDTKILHITKLIHDPLEDVLNDYREMVKKSILHQHKELNVKQKLVFVYTPMHGVGYRYVKEVFKDIGIHFHPVEEQKDPDPEFPTVKFPNPEEGKSSLDLAFKTADKFKSRIVIANDPDADRMATAEKNQKTGEWKVFSGNELGALLGWWIYKTYLMKNPEEDPKNIYMLSSTVSSMILRTMAAKEGFNFVETLTGFKWLGNKMNELMLQGKKPIFAYEQAIGFCCGTAVLDKDGISAACQLATFTSFLDKDHKTLTDKLQEIYTEYGPHLSLDSYYICSNPEKIRNIFERIRTIQDGQTYASNILHGKYHVKTIRDLTTGFDNAQPNNKAVLPVSRSNEMITFNFTNGMVCTLRTSGTEPKIKYYAEMCATPEDDLSSVEATLQEMVTAIVGEFLQPEENELEARSE